jgi:hypothetical protein
MKSILIYDLFYYVTFDIISFLLKINGDKYVLVVIGHHLVVWGVTNERTLCYNCNQASRRRNYMHSWGTYLSWKLMEENDWLNLMCCVRVHQFTTL